MQNNKVKRGPVPSGDTRSEIERRSAKKSRQRRAEAGYVEVKTFVVEDTKRILTELKNERSLQNIGEAIDFLAAEWKKNQTTS